MRRGADVVQVSGPRGRSRRGDAAGDAQARGLRVLLLLLLVLLVLLQSPSGELARPALGPGGARPGIPACDAPGACDWLRLRRPTQLPPGRPRAGVG